MNLAVSTLAHSPSGAVAQGAPQWERSIVDEVEVVFVAECQNQTPPQSADRYREVWAVAPPSRKLLESAKCMGVEVGKAIRYRQKIAMIVINRMK